MTNHNRAQGALEYMLLIAGAILVVAIVIAFLTGMTEQTKQTTNTQLQEFLNNVTNSSP